MSGGIFVIQDNGELVEMSERPYDSEDLLQKLLAQYPNLLAGDQINSTTPRKWLLITREMGVPDKEDSSDRWSVDHLFLDQDAIPTLVEVKRSSDSRIRREVVGQMLDYAANAVVYWPIEKISAQFEATCKARNLDTTQVLNDFLGVEADLEQFWQKAKTNLQAGKVRMIFVADVIPPELRRIVEFLNEQMDPAEVLAVEIKQYVATSQQLKTLVPRVFGQIEKKPPIVVKKQWNEELFLEALKVKKDSSSEIARKILRWAIANNLQIRWGTGKDTGSAIVYLKYKGKEQQLFALWTNGSVEILFAWYNKEFFDDEKKRELLRQLNSIPDISIPMEAINRRPWFWLMFLRDDSALTKFFDTFKWFAQQIKDKVSEQNNFT